MRLKTIVRDRKGNVLPNLGEVKEYEDLPAEHHSMMFSLVLVCLKTYKKLAVPKPKKDMKQAQLCKEPVVDMPNLGDTNKSSTRQRSKSNQGKSDTEESVNPVTKKVFESIVKANFGDDIKEEREETVEEKKTSKKKKSAIRIDDQK